MNIRIIIAAAALCAVASQASAKEKIYVNSDVTTHIVMPENIKMVDLSTAKIIGNQCADNIVRVKPFMESDSLPSGYREYAGVSSTVCELVAFTSFLSVSFTRTSAMLYGIFVRFCNE